MRDPPRTKAPPVRSPPVGVVVFCAGLTLASVALLALGVVRGSLSALAALAVMGVIVAAALGIALAFGRGRIAQESSMWELLPFWVVFTLATEQVLGAAAALAVALLYPAVVIGLRLFAPRSWLRVEMRPWMRDAGEDGDAAHGAGADGAVPGTRVDEGDGETRHTPGEGDTRPTRWLRRRRGGEETADVVARAEGSDRDVSVALIDVPVLRSESGRLRLRDVDATVAMLDAVDDWLPRAVPPASRRKPWHCPVCVTAQPLDPGRARPVTHELQVHPREGPPFGLEVTIPSVACPGCGRAFALLDEERADALREAMIASLGSAGIHRE